MSRRMWTGGTSLGHLYSCFLFPTPNEITSSATPQCIAFCFVYEFYTFEFCIVCHTLHSSSNIIIPPFHFTWTLPLHSLTWTMKQLCENFYLNSCEFCMLGGFHLVVLQVKEILVNAMCDMRSWLQTCIYGCFSETDLASIKMFVKQFLYTSLFIWYEFTTAIQNVVWHSSND